MINFLVYPRVYKAKHKTMMPAKMTNRNVSNIALFFL